MATDQDARDFGFITPAGSDPIANGDDAIRHNARANVDLHRQVTAAVSRRARAAHTHTAAELVALGDATSGSLSDLRSERAYHNLRTALSTGGHARVVTMGDSKSRGYGVGDYLASWPVALTEQIGATTGVAVDQYWHAEPDQWVTPRTTITAGALTTDDVGMGFSGVHLPPGESVTYTAVPAAGAVNLQTWHMKHPSAAGALEVLIDGALVATITDTHADPHLPTVVHTALATPPAGPVDVVLRCPSTSTYPVRVMGVMFDSPGADRITHYNVSRGGTEARHFAIGKPEQTNGELAWQPHWQSLALIDPHLLIVPVGANDMGRAYNTGLGGPTEWAEWLGIILEHAREYTPNAGVVLVHAAPILEDPLGAHEWEVAARAVIGAKPRATIHYESSLWKPTAAGDDPWGWLADSVHPGAAAHAIMSRFHYLRTLGPTYIEGPQGEPGIDGTAAPHADTHAAGGTDPITPGSIGAQDFSTGSMTEPFSADSMTASGTWWISNQITPANGFPAVVVPYGLLVVTGLAEIYVVQTITTSGPNEVESWTRVQRGAGWSVWAKLTA